MIHRLFSTRSTTNGTGSAPIIRRLVVGDHDHASSVEQFVASQLGVRKSFARLKIINGEVSICQDSAHGRRLGQAANANLKPAAKLHAGDVVEVALPNSAAAKSATSNTSGNSPTTPSFNIANSLLYKDQHILIINKPRLMPVQSGSKVSQSIADMLHLLQFSNPEPPRLVHRLDKDTTGCLVLARTRDAATRLSTLFSDDSEDCVLQKKYQAVVCGTPSENSGRITTGIIQVGVPPREKLSVIEWHESDDLPDNKNAVKKAVSDFKILAKQKHVSHLELSPATGRKHQLRLHCAEFLKTPILGDYKYGPGCPKQLRSAFGNIKTVPIHLHMYEISIRDWYGEGKNLCVQAPLPAHFTRTLKTFNLGGKSSGDQDAVKAVDENSE